MEDRDSLLFSEFKSLFIAPARCVSSSCWTRLSFHCFFTGFGVFRSAFPVTGFMLANIQSATCSIQYSRRAVPKSSPAQSRYFGRSPLEKGPVKFRLSCAAVRELAAKSVSHALVHPPGHPQTVFHATLLSARLRFFSSWTETRASDGALLHRRPMSGRPFLQPMSTPPRRWSVRTRVRTRNLYMSSSF